MPTRKCCCFDCELGEDNFNRANANPPTGQWHVIGGEWEILDNELNCITPGILATTICHPSQFQYGSYIVTMKLVGLRTWEYLEVGAGDPTNPVYKIQWVPLDMDTVDAKIRIRIYNGTEWSEFDQIWTSSADTVNVQICYLPGAHIKASAGPEPELDVCIPLNPHDNCYDDSGTSVGNFWFERGTFDDWTYQATIIDDVSCLPCGCFCFIYDNGRLLNEWSCFPEELTLTLEVTEGECEALDDATYTLRQGNLQPDDGHPEKKSWFSDVESCNSPSFQQYTFIADCTPMVNEDGKWFLALSLRIGNGSYTNATTIFTWDDPSSPEWLSGSSRLANPDVSTCDPINLVFENLKLQSVFGPCGLPGEFGHTPYCCGGGCTPTAPNIRFTVRITE